MTPWPDIPLQPPGSELCGPYAVSYLTALLGVPRTPEEVGGFDASYRDGAFYPEKALGIEPVWRMYGGGRQIPGGIMFGFSAGFRYWCRAYVKAGCVGFAHVFLTERMGHAAVLLEADEGGVLLADPARGLVRDRWEEFESHVGRPAPGERPSSGAIKAWYKLPGAVR